jgi:serine/threonine protein kinase
LGVDLSQSPPPTTAAEDSLFELSGPTLPLPGRRRRPGALLSPGALLGDRYRIVSFLGGGGMGVVYRADDLRLGLPVALKFVGDGPEELQQRLIAEVRLAREVTHPNVCRVYDLGELDGHSFLTMELIEGEDLASLLRRLGRLPIDQVIAIARQVCEGLHAAHARGVLHRDLKPANVMLDARGQVRIVDFGLAEKTEGPDLDHAGTPAYMAPEQLAGEEMTARTDIWALGSLLYKLLAGTHPYPIKALTELRHRMEGPPAPLSTFVPEIDPKIEAIIMRCLEVDPAQRPPTAAAVSAAFPSAADPLIALLASGVTPPPELVAAAGPSGYLPARVADLLFGSALLLVLLAAWVGAATGLLARLPELERPSRFAERAQAVLTLLGLPPPVESASSFELSLPFRRFVTVPVTWSDPGSPLNYWFRGAPGALEPGLPRYFMSRQRAGRAGLATGLRILPEEPRSRPGEVLVKLSPAGKLVWLRVHRHESVTQLPGRIADFGPLLAAAGLADTVAPADVGRSSFKHFPTLALPFDRTYDWRIERPNIGLLRVQGASLNGQPVAFEVAPAGQRRENENRNSRHRDLNLWLLPILYFIALAGSAWSARINLRRDRANREGARRGGWAFAGMSFVAALLAAHPVKSAFVTEMLMQSLVKALALGVSFWLLFLGIEPAVRRIRPRLLIATERLLEGRFGDPLVGRELLLGVLCGAAVFSICQPLLSRRGLINLPQVDALEGGRSALRLLLETAIFELLAVPVAMFLLATLSRLLGRPIFAAALLTLVLALGYSWGSPVAFGISAFFFVGFFTLALRVGALAVAIYGWTWVLLSAAPLSTNSASAAFPATLCTAGALAVLALWGYLCVRETPAATTVA